MPEKVIGYRIDWEDRLTEDRLTEYFPPTFGYTTGTGKSVDYAEILVDTDGLPHLHKNITEKGKEQMIAYVSFEADTSKLFDISVVVRDDFGEDPLKPGIFTWEEMGLLAQAAREILCKYRGLENDGMDEPERD